MFLFSRCDSRLLTLPAHSLRHISSTTGPGQFKSPSQQMELLGKKLIGDITLAPQHGWKSTFRRNRQHKELPKTLIDTVSDSFSRAAIPHPTKGPEEDFLIDLVKETSKDHLRFPVGSFVEVRRNHMTTHGIIVQRSKTAEFSKCVTLTSTGDIWQHLYADIMFAIPSFASEELLSCCGVDAEKITPLAASTRIILIKAIREFEKRVNTIMQSIDSWSSKAYERFRSQDPNIWSSITTETALQSLPTAYRKPKPETLLAIHKHLMSQSLYFEANRYIHRNIHAFTVRPYSHVQNFQTVSNWVRMKSSALERFALKAKTIIQTARRFDAEDYYGLPQVRELELPSFTSDDIEFILFLRLSMRRTRASQADPYAPFVPVILKMIGMHEGVNIEEGATLRLLQDLGIFTPWEDPLMHGDDLDTVTRPGAIQPTKNDLDDLITQRAKLPMGVTTMAPGPSNFYPNDLLESVRHDWGRLPVYAIDDSEAEELDDGLSIETLNDGSHWLHVHVADPTLAIHPQHTLTRQAFQQPQTMYLVQETRPMLPKSLTQSRFSLNARSQGQEVMTFSTRIDSRGNIVDSKVQAGLVRNLVLVRYDDLDKALGMKDATVSYPFPWAQPPPITPVPIQAAHMTDFQALAKASASLSRKRLENPIFCWDTPEPKITIQPKPLPSNPSSPSSPIFYRGFPEIMASLGHFHNSPARQLVKESMVAAGRAAGRFLAERGISGLYRSLTPPSFTDNALLPAILAARDTFGYVPIELPLRALRSFPVGSYTGSPSRHWALGIHDDEGYIRVTSPLRRYGDLFMHWQIKAALAPKSMGISKGFSMRDVLQVAEHLESKERLLGKLSRLNVQFWQLLLLKRWIEQNHNKEPPLYPLRAIPVGPAKRDGGRYDLTVAAVVPSLSVQAFIRGPKLDLPIGYEVSTRVSDITFGSTGGRLWLEKVD